jgi:hypothetical protein
MTSISMIAKRARRISANAKHFDGAEEAAGRQPQAPASACCLAWQSGSRSIVDPPRWRRLPVLRKPDLMQMQEANPPFGGLADPDALKGNRVFMSPGPVWEPQGLGVDPWASARALFAAGFRSGDLVHNSLAYHMTPGGFILDEGARALGCLVFPAGIGNTEAQVDAASGSSRRASPEPRTTSRPFSRKPMRLGAICRRSGAPWSRAAHCFPRCANITATAA